MTHHAKLSPSKRHRWSRCPGSIREEEKYPEQRDNPAAIDGTHSHTLLDTCIKLGMMPSANFVGRTLKDDDGEFTVDADRAERVQFALDYIASISDGCTVIAEERVDPEYLTKVKGLDGTVDVQVVSDSSVEIIDYKDGMSPTDAVEQLEQYMIGVLAGMSDAQRAGIKQITLTVVQPKLRTRGMPGVITRAIAPEDGNRILNELVDQAVATNDPNAPLVPGDSQCKYCRAKGGCSTLVTKTMEASGIAFANLDVAQQAADKEPTTMTDEQIKEILESAPLIRQMLDGVEAEALRRFEVGHPISGLKAVRGRGSRSWAFDDETIEKSLIKFGIPKGSLHVVKLVSPAQVEKLVWTKRDGTQKQLTDKQLSILKGEYIKKSDGKLQVVSESDDRPAVIISAAGMFPAIVPDFLKPSEGAQNV